MRRTRAVAFARPRPRWRSRVDDHGTSVKAKVLAAVLAIVAAPPASAQVAGNLSAQNDYRVRGYSISAGQPVAILNLSYDHPSGIYLNGSGVGSLHPEDGPLLDAAFGEIGYARRLAPTLSIDGGLMRSEFWNIYGQKRASGYTEAYLGLISHGLSAHIYYSPDYLSRGVSTVYGEIDDSIEVVAQFRLNAHLGVLGYLDAPAAAPARDTQYDWRLGASRQFGVFDVHAAVTGGGPGHDFYYGRTRSKTALVVGAGWTF
jgi:uncharacterized protein (TIGR02001 family)